MSDNKKYKFNYADEEQQRYLDAETALAPKTKITDIIVTFTLLAVIFGIGIAFFALPDKTFSENENRALQTMPDMSLKNIASGKFTEEFSTYFTDQFPARDAFVSIKAACEIALGKNENNGVLFGKDGHLIDRMDDAAEYSSYRDSFGGRSDFVPSYLAATERTAETLKANAEAVARFAEAAKALGIDTTFAVAGRHSDIAADTSWLYPASADDAVWDVLNGTGVTYLDLMKPLKARFDAGEYVYYRTDHHWTTLGAYYGYAEIMRAFGEMPEEIGHYERETVSDSFYGTTWSSSGIRFVRPDTMEYFHISGDEDGKYEVDFGGEKRASLYDRSYLEKKDKYSSFISDNRARTDITKADAENREKLLVIKDSFAMSLVPFLAEKYDIVMIDLRYYKTGTALSIVENENIDKVLVLYNMDSLTSDPTIAMIAAGTSK